MTTVTPKTFTVPKIEQVKKLICRKQSATVASIEKATSWQPHTIRAALSGLRRKGATVTRDQNAKGETLYRMEA